MSSYIIEGGKKLEGETYVSGSKNASLPIMAATILNKGISPPFMTIDFRNHKPFSLLQFLRSHFSNPPNFSIRIENRG